MYFIGKLNSWDLQVGNALGSVPHLSQLQPRHVKIHLISHCLAFYVGKWTFSDKPPCAACSPWLNSHIFVILKVSTNRCSCSHRAARPAIPVPAAAGDQEQKCQAGDWMGPHGCLQQWAVQPLLQGKVCSFMIPFCNYPRMQAAGMEMFLAETLCLHRLILYFYNYGQSESKTVVATWL